MNEELNMKNIDIPGAKEIFAKQDELMNTFWCNRGSVKALLIIHQEVKKDMVLDKMRMMRYNNIYEKNAREWYSKHGTQGEF